MFSMTMPLHNVKSIKPLSLGEFIKPVWHMQICELIVPLQLSIPSLPHWSGWHFTLKIIELNQNNNLEEQNMSKPSRYLPAQS